MEIVKFVYCNKEYYFKNHLIFTGTTDFNEEKRDEVFVKFIRSKNSYSLKEYWNLSDKELLDEMIINELSKPKTWPKFSNEESFQIKFNGKTIIRPTIIAIRWNGYIWEYRIKNIGHEYDYQPETALEKITKPSTFPDI
jgi:hypothetical protein